MDAGSLTAFRAIRAFERGQAASYKRALADFKTLKAIYDKQRESALRTKAKLTDPDALRNELDALGEEPLPPLDTAMTTEEPTFEGLIKLFDRGRPCLGLVTSEGGRLIGAYGMSAEHQLKTGAGLSELWDGSQLTRVRAKDGESLTTQGKRLGLSIMAQPGVGLQFVNNQVLVDQGLNSRILVAWPKSMAGSREYQSIDLREDPITTEFHRIITAHLGTPFRLAEGQRNELNPRELSLSANAKRTWVLVYSDIERELDADGRFAPIRGLASKGAEHVLRIAGNLALFGDLQCSEVHTRDIDHARELVEYYLIEALRIRGAAGCDPDLELASKTMAWARKEGGRFGMSRVYTHGPYGIRDKSTAHKIVKILEEHHQILKLPENTMIGEKRFRDAWEVNSCED